MDISRRKSKEKPVLQVTSEKRPAFLIHDTLVLLLNAQ